MLNLNNKNSKKIRHLFKKTVAPEKLNYLEEKERKKLERQRTRKIEELEQNIVQFEEEIATLEDQLCLPEIYADYEKASEITTKKANTTRTT